jgi:hypothetical protein
MSWIIIVNIYKVTLNIYFDYYVTKYQTIESILL